MGGKTITLEHRYYSTTPLYSLFLSLLVNRSFDSACGPTDGGGRPRALPSHLFRLIPILLADFSAYLGIKSR